MNNNDVALKILIENIHSSMTSLISDVATVKERVDQIYTRQSLNYEELKSNQEDYKKIQDDHSKYINQKKTQEKSKKNIYNFIKDNKSFILWSFGIIGFISIYSVGKINDIINLIQ